MADDVREGQTEQAVDAKPGVDAKPATDAKPGLDAKPTADAKPGAASRVTVTLAADARSAAPATPAAAAEAKPAAGEQKPAAEAKPAVTAKPAAAAAKPVKAPPPPDPRAVAAAAAAEQIKASLERALGPGVVDEVGASKDVPQLLIANAKWLAAVRFLRDDPEHAYNYVELFAGTDYLDKGYIEVVMYVQSTTHDRFVNLKVRTPRDNARVDSLTGLYPGVNWEEREVYDLLGVTFTGHPDLRRIMMWEGWNGYPLRKDYSPFENIPVKGGDGS